MMQKNVKLLLFILIFIQNVLFNNCFNVNFREFYDVKVEEVQSSINKRDMTQFFDKASYSFNGFDKVESVPVTFPLDICLMDLEGVKYASTLHKCKNGINNFAVFKLSNSVYELLLDKPLPNAIAIDCKAIGTHGYVAIALNITTAIENAREGSPIYEIFEDRIRAVQYFSSTNMRSVYLSVTGNDLFLLQAFHNTKTTPNPNCPYFKWSGTTFNKLGHIPCTNARHLEPFSIDYEVYVAVANYANQYERTNINSEIYKLNRATQKFQLLQKIETNGAVDVKHFKVPQNAVRNQHFLIFGNSISKRLDGKPGEHLEADSVIYIFDKGEFLPYQSISLYAVEKFLPIENQDAEKFLLLVASANQDIQIYNLNDWKFEVSNVQYTEGALSKGVAKMRVFEENETSYLVIANELMTDNETNIFQPIFKQEEHANALREEIINWTKANIARLASIDIEKLKNDVEHKINQHEMQPIDITDLPNANISTVITKALKYAPMHLNSDYWLALKYANKAMDVLETLYPPSRQQKREINQLSSMPDNLVYEFKDIHLKTLIVRETLKAEIVNGISTASPQFDSVKSKQISKANAKSLKNANEKLLKVEQLQLNGKLNGFTWPQLLNNSLKRDGLQFIKSNAHFNKLRTAKIIITNNEINQQNLAKLIPINGGQYVVNQDVQFAAPVKAKTVIINDRLNNIHVHKHKFDVLLKYSNETQIVEGAKNFENIKVLEPVTMGGKILGAHLREMLPNKAIHEPLILNGDYTINGDVKIRKMLLVNDLLDVNNNLSIAELLHNGISFNDIPLNDVNLKFDMPIIANNSMVSFINNVDLQQLLRTNIDEVQIVEGAKFFKQSVTIQQGFSEVKYLNTVDIERLEEQLFLKHTNQTIKVPMHFETIIAKGLNATAISLKSKSLEHFLTRTGDQNIQGTLRVDNLETQTLNVTSFNTNGNIFNASLKDIYQQRAKIVPIESIFKPAHKFNGSIYVRNLIINDTINGKAVSEIERQLTQLEGNIKYVGNFNINYAMSIANLSFEGALNGIKAEDFGKCWLQKHGKQIFTAPQTLASLACERGLQVNGKLNNHQLADFYEQTYWLTRDEHMENVKFVNPIQMQGVLNTEKLNELFVPNDVLFRQAAHPQTLNAELHVHGNVNVEGHIMNTTHINGHNMKALQQYLNGQNYDTLHLEHVNFTTAPLYQTLNRHNLQHCLDKVWLANENVVLPQHVEIADAYFNGLLDFEGPINNMNLKYVQENYISLSQPQDIHTELIFADAVNFENDLLVDEAYLFGPINVSNSNAQFNFDEFVANTLKISGTHQISGHWHMEQAQVAGDLDNVQINKLDLAKDVLRMDMPIATITARKYLKSANIQKLYATPQSRLNNVPIADWMRQTAYIYDNVTIYGTTTIDAINLFNDLSLRGQLNNITFQPDNLLLSNNEQIINGNVHIQNAFPSEQRFLTNNIENLNVAHVNGRSFLDFLQQVATQNATQVVKSHLIFKQPLTVQTYHGNSGVDELRQVKRAAVAQFRALASLEHAVENLKNTIKGRQYTLDHFEIVQTLPVAATEISVFEIERNGTIIERIGLMDAKNNNSMQVYYWQNQLQQFVLDEEFEIKDFLRGQKLGIQYSYMAYDHQAKLNQSRAYEMFNIKEHYCMALYGVNSSTFDINCMHKTKNFTIDSFEKYAQIPRADVQQFFSLDESVLVLRLANAIETWNIDAVELQQSIKLEKTMKAAVAKRAGVTYLAVISANGTDSTMGNLDIYCISNYTLVHSQHTAVRKPSNLAFTTYTKSDDLLLHLISSTSPTSQSLFIYQFKGIMGFDLLSVNHAGLPANVSSLSIVELKTPEKDFLVLRGTDETTFVEIVYKL